MRAFQAWPIIIIFYSILAVYIAPPAYRIVQQSKDSPQKLVDRIKDQLRNHPAVGRFNIWDRIAWDLDDVLFTDYAFYPSPQLSPLFRQFLRLDCKQTHPRPINEAEEKTILWVNYKCNRSALPSNFFKKPPYMHPRGGSWVWYAHQTESDFSSQTWLDQHRAFLNVIELASIIKPSEASPLWKEIILSLSPSELLPLQHEWENFVVSSHYVFVRNPDQPDFQVYARETWNKTLEESALEFARNEYTDCILPEGKSGCWVINNEKIESSRNKIALLIAGLVVLLLLMILRLLRSRSRLLAQAASHRLLMVQTLTHELRHPVTGMRLSLESFRDNYDELNDTLREEFLRMTNHMQKLQRLILASEQYLQKNKHEQLFSFKKIKVESCNQYFIDLLEPFQERVTFAPATEDRPMQVDPYWFGMCVSNLVKNALMHGQQPIYVAIEFTNQADAHYIAVSVTDSGKGLPHGKLDLSEKVPKNPTSTGMGLGLHLVSQIMQLMGGNIFYRHSPLPTFTLRMEISSEDNPAR